MSKIVLKTMWTKLQLAEAMEAAGWIQDSDDPAIFFHEITNCGLNIDGYRDGRIIWIDYAISNEIPLPQL